MGENELIAYIRDDYRKIDAKLEKLSDEIQRINRDQGTECSSKRADIYKQIDDVNIRVNKLETAVAKLNMGLAASGFVAGSAVTALIGIIVKKAFGG